MQQTRLDVQFTVAGLLYSASPAERAVWQPSANDSDVAERMRQVQRRDYLLQGKYLFRARLTYDVGIVSLLAALLALVTPPHNWLSWRGTAFAVVAAALTVELVWVVGGRTRHVPGWLLPSYRHTRQ